MTIYWAADCAFCNQGRLFIFRRSDLGTLYLHCEECEYGWDRLEEVADVAAGFLTVSVDFESTEPTLAEIQAFGWGHAVRGHIR
jgi:hypothetical protein